MNELDTHTFTSTRVDTATYDPEYGTITVRFPDGVRWRYHGIAPQTWDDFKRAASPGRFLATVLDAHSNGPA